MSDHDWQLSSSTVEFRQAERDAANGRDIRDRPDRQRACVRCGLQVCDCPVAVGPSDGATGELPDRLP